MIDDKHITYLFGAGASYNAMPIVSELNYDMYALSINLLTTRPKGSERLIELIEQDWSMGQSKSWLAKNAVEALKFQSIDTYSRFLHLREQSAKLEQIKRSVDLFFAIKTYRSNMLKMLGNAPEDEEYLHARYEEGHRQHKVLKARVTKAELQNRNTIRLLKKATIDTRYDSMLAALLRKSDTGISLPDNTSFLSWNYDLQFEQSFAKFVHSGKGIPSSSTIKEARVLHLNGHFTPPNDEIIKFRGQWNRIDNQYFENIAESGGKSIQYAWEMSAERKRQLDNILSNTTHLVVIGYSFPVFNREIDRQILEATNLKKVYLQDKEDALAGIENRVKALLGERADFVPAEYKIIRTMDGSERVQTAEQLGVEIERVDSTDQFHIPFELR